jgi:peptidoglycan/xylan/chitin deacetylase (PgdA/CDA1 family)
MPLPSKAKNVAKAIVRKHTGFVGSVVAIKTAAPNVVITFDDGPEPGGTDRILAALADKSATATFFVLLSRVRRYRTLLHEVLAAGHEVALHGVDHQALTSFSYADAKRRTAAAHAELEDRTGAPVRWFRPPYGLQSPATWAAVKQLGLMPVMWGLTTWDWRDISQEERVRKAQQGLRRGAIVLAHDAFAGALDGVPQQVAPVLDRGDLVKRVLSAYGESGLVGRSLRDALSVGTLEKAAWFAG